MITDRESVVNTLQLAKLVIYLYKFILHSDITPIKWLNGDKVVLSGDKLALNGDNTVASGDKHDVSGDNSSKSVVTCQESVVTPLPPNK